MLVRIIAPHFVAGVTLDWGLVVRFAPILSYMRGWTLYQVIDYTQRKRWQMEIL